MDRLRIRSDLIALSGQPVANADKCRPSFLRITLSWRKELMRSRLYTRRCSRLRELFSYLADGLSISQVFCPAGCTTRSKVPKTGVGMQMIPPLTRQRRAIEMATNFSRSPMCAPANRSAYTVLNTATKHTIIPTTSKRLEPAYGCLAMIAN